MEVSSIVHSVFLLFFLFLLLSRKTERKKSFFTRTREYAKPLLTLEKKIKNKSPCTYRLARSVSFDVVRWKRKAKLVTGDLAMGWGGPSTRTNYARRAWGTRDLPNGMKYLPGPGQVWGGGRTWVGGEKLSIRGLYTRSKRQNGYKFVNFFILFFFPSKFNSKIVRKIDFFFHRIVSSYDFTSHTACRF